MSGATKLMTPGGGGVSLTPASSIASDVTVNVPSQNCTLDIQGPAFSAYAGTVTSVPNATSTKIIFDTEEFDTNNNFSSSRFTPTVAGYYQITGAVYMNAGANYGGCQIYKNGAAYKSGPLANFNGAGVTSIVSAIVYFNGTTDYIEIYAYQASGATVNAQAVSSYTFFQGCLVRAA